MNSKKQFLFFLALSFCISANGQEGVLSKDDRKYLVNYMNETLDQMKTRIETLTQDQWAYKPDTGTWSLAEIAEHIYIVEKNLMNRAKSITEQEYAPEKLAQADETEEKLIDFIVGRETKVKAPAVVSPTGQFPTPDSFLENFIELRKENIRYVKTTKESLKVYFQSNRLFGELNGYHWLVFIPAHNQRHMIQMDEVLAIEGFPAKS